MRADHSFSRRTVLAGLGFSLVPVMASRAADESPRVRLGVLRFGTAAWELGVIQRHSLDRKGGVAIEVRELASGEAGKVALLAGSVDMIVSDWVWVMRQRSEGAGLVFSPYSRAVGALELPASSPIRKLEELEGKRLGVAGGPLDKSWILLRALSLRETERDLANIVQPVFGAPPLLEQEFLAGRLDGALTSWNFAARLEAAGARPLLTVSDMLSRLGVSRDIPMLGYVFQESWARANPDAIARFMDVSKAAKTILATSDSEWQALAPQLGTDDKPLQIALRNAYRAGIPRSFGNREVEDGGRLFSVLARLGGEALVGRADTLDPSIFWTVPDIGGGPGTGAGNGQELGRL
ncbi:ABC transporter substrate-binding protein [Mesorhizobium sp. M1423]|uniref:ABC transporter substrate-binding protein n=1 Tax=Mesorhizobium sp. M1423 TaxID=2957101 RepID=UPI0033351B40